MSTNDSEGRSTSTCTAKAQAPQPTKRRPDTDLNHDNWDQEEEPEEKGEFKKAPDDQLKDRKILTAKRKTKPGSQTSSNPFGGMNLAPAFSTKNNGNDKNPSQQQNNPNPVSMFNFASLAASAAAPKFDFSCITSTTTNSGKERPEHQVGSSSADLLRSSERVGGGNPSGVGIGKLKAKANAEEAEVTGGDNTLESTKDSVSKPEMVKEPEVITLGSSNGDNTREREASLIMDSNSKPDGKESEDSSGPASYISDETGPGDEHSNSATKA